MSRPFEREQRAFQRETAAETTERAARGEHAMARNYEWNRVLRHGAADRPRSARFAHATRELAVRQGVSKAHLGELDEHATTEPARERPVEPSFEATALARGVLGDLPEHRRAIVALEHDARSERSLETARERGDG